MEELEQQARKERLEKRKEKRELYRKMREENRSGTDSDGDGDDVLSHGDGGGGGGGGELASGSDEAVDEREFDAARPGERVVVTVEQMASRDGPYEPRRPEEGASTGPVQNAAPRGIKRAPKLGLRKKRMYRGGQTARGTKSKGSKRRKNRGRDP